LICLALAASLLAGCSFFSDDVPREEIVDYVKENIDVLDDFAARWTGKSENESATIRDEFGRKTIIKSVYRYDGSVIQFYCGGTGLSVSSTYSGFYYSPEDAPFGFEFDHRVGWEQTGEDCWYWAKDGDSVTVERILPHWFYYHIVWP
jgi:hypothetical protein